MLKGFRFEVAAAREVAHEVAVLHGERWVSVHSSADEKQALQKARLLLANDQIAAVRVVRECVTPAGFHQRVPVLEERRPSKTSRTSALPTAQPECALPEQRISPPDPAHLPGLI